MASGAFQEVMIVAWNPIESSDILVGPPFQFTIQIPGVIDPGIYALTAHGFTSPGQDVTSDPIMIDVERSDAPVAITTDPSAL